MLGVYSYRQYRETGLVEFSMRVEVLAETPKCYRVKYLEPHANGALAGNTALVQKRNVKVERPIQPKELDNWKPYKDD